jgi:Tol biopolymer transport system component
VAFVSEATDLVPGDTNGVNDVFVLDVQKGIRTRVSVDSAGNQANAATPLPEPAISGDSRFVAFVSNATNLVAGDSNNVADIFVHDRQTGATTRVSVNSSGGQANGGSSDPVISPDGRYVAFVSNAGNLVIGDTNGKSDVFVHDRQTGVTARVSVNSSEEQGNAESINPSISADGRYVAFGSSASNLVTGDTNGVSDVFVRDRQTGATTRVSMNNTGTQGKNSSGQPSLSADGRYVAFTSEAGNLVPGDSNGTADVFVHDRQAEKTTRVGVDGDSPSISGDGRFVAFRSYPLDPQVSVHDRQTQITDIAAYFFGGPPSISSDGRFVVYGSYIAAVPRISIEVYPSYDPGPGQTQFGANLYPATGSVNWNINPAVGGITAEGLYTAPASVQTPLLVTVSARSTVDATRSGAYWLGVGRPTGEIKYGNTFDSPFLDAVYERVGWKVIDEGNTGGPSNWKIVDSVLTQTSDIFGGSVDAFSPDKPGTYLLLPSYYYNPDDYTVEDFNPFKWKNYTVTARLRSTDDDAIGLMFGYKDANNYYRFSMDRERKYRRLVKVVNGIFSVLAEDSVAYQLGRWYNVQATMARGIIQILIDGQELFNVRDTSHGQGSIALYSWNNTGPEFDDLAVVQSTKLGCTYSFEPKNVDVGAQAVNGAVNVATQDDCAWSVTSNAPWITIGSADMSGFGSWTVHYQVAANTNATAREKALSLDSGAKFTVRQAGTSGGSGLPFGDDFSAGTWPGAWTVVDEGTIDAPSHWYVQDGILNQTSNIYGGDASALPAPGTYALTGQTSWTNYTVAVKMKSTDDDGIGLLFGYKDSKNYYRFSMDRQQGYRRLVKVVNGVFTKLAEDAVAYAQNQWYTVQASMMKGRIKIIFNGQTLFTTDDSSHTAGKVGLYSWNNTGAQFDEFAVRTAAGTTTHCVSDAGQLHTALLAAASNGQNDVIRLVRGQYNGNFYYSPNEALDLTILGGYSTNCASRVVDPANTVLDGRSLCAVFQLKTERAADLALKGVTLRNGGAGENCLAAGGLSASSAGEVTLTGTVLSHSDIIGNNSDFGGGANIWAARVTMSDNTVEENSAEFSAGLYIVAQTVELTGNKVRKNQAIDSSGHGASENGGLFIACPGYFDGSACAGAVTLTGNVIEENDAAYNGGAYCRHDKLLIQNNIIRENGQSIDVGGASFSGSEITFVNNVVANNDDQGNSAVTLGGTGVVHVINNTITGNNAPLLVGSEGPVYIYNNIFFNNACWEGYCSDFSAWSNQGIVKLFNNDFSPSNLPDGVDPSNLAVDPLFVDAANGNYRLQPSSPVINKGTNTAPKLPAKDIEDRARILLGKVDMGAYEATGSSLGAPVNPSPANAATGVVLTPTLTWTAGLGATSHDVYFGATSPPPLVTNTTGTSYTPPALTANKKYYWKVVAKAGSKSASSAIWSFRTGNPAPSDPLPANGATGVLRTPTLRWAPGLGATSHDVYFGPTSPPPLVTNTTGTTFGPGTLSATKKYYWKIVAKGGGVDTSSPIWSFTTK